MCCQMMPWVIRERVTDIVAFLVVIHLLRANNDNDDDDDRHYLPRAHYY